MKPWSLVHRGRVPAAAVWIDRRLIGAQPAMERVIALWQPGDVVFELDGGFLLRFGRGRDVDAVAPGTPLIERGGCLIAAPLRDEEWGDRPAGSVILVRGGAAVGLELPKPLDPAAWLRVELPYVAVAPCAPPPAVGTAARGSVAVGRRAFGVEALSDEAQDLLSSLSTGEPAVAAPPPPPPPSAPGWFGKLAGWFGGPAPAQAPQRPPTGPRAPGMFDGLGAFLERMVGGGMEGVGMHQTLQRLQQTRLEALLERFDGDLEEALRHAIPLGGDGSMRSHPALRMPAPRDRLTPGLSPAGGSGGTFGAGEDLYRALTETYRKAAEKLVADGEIEKASFVWADLLGDSERAVRVLEEHGRFELAAQLAEARDQPAAKVARLYVLAGDIPRALKIARSARVFGELLASFTGKDDTLLRAAYAADLVSLGRYRAAVDVLWPSPLRSATQPWLEVLIASEVHRAEALVQLAELDPGAAEAVFRAVILEPGAVEARRRTCVALVANGAPRGWARPLARMLIGDDGEPGFDPEPLTQLLRWPELADLRVDVPVLSPRTPGQPGPKQFPASTAGGTPILDIVGVHAGTLCALGEGGLALLDRVGRVVWRDPSPCTWLVGDTEGFRVIALHPVGTCKRLRVIDVRSRAVVPWVDTVLDRWAPTAHDGQWLVCSGTHLSAIDLVASLGSSSWKWCWKGPELDGPVLAIDQGPTESWVAFGAPLNERWKYDDLWFLRGRTPLPESFEQVELHGARWAGLQGDQVVVEDQGLRRFPVGPGGRCVAVTPREVWWAEPDDQGVTVTTGPRAAQPVRLEGAGRVGARWRSPGWLGIHDDQGRVLWLDTEHGHLEGPHRL